MTNSLIYFSSKASIVFCLPSSVKDKSILRLSLGEGWLFTLELARQLSETKVTVNALNPGFNVTGLGRELSFASILEAVLKFFNIGNPSRGAGIITSLAVDEKYNGITGGYFDVKAGAPIVPIYPGNNEEMQKKLWNDTKTLLKQKGFK